MATFAFSSIQLFTLYGEVNNSNNLESMFFICENQLIFCFQNTEVDILHLF